MPKLVRWKKVVGKDIPTCMVSARLVYKDTETEFYLRNHDSRSGLEQVWEVVSEDGKLLKGVLSCGGFKLKQPPIKWASKIASNNRSCDSVEKKEEKWKTGTAAEFLDLTEEGEEQVKAKLTEEQPKKRGRGRPPGSKNKSKAGKKKKRKKGL